MDSTLAYIDQGSFLGLRALGRGPIAQFVWIYEHPVDLEGLRRMHRNLGHGLLGRRIEKSPLPFGRHHWVHWPGPADIEEVQTVRPRDEVIAWADELIRRPIDPEHGPSWRLAVQPLAGGATAVSLTASHTVCDGLALTQAVAEAASGVTRDLHYPEPGSRPRGRALREDTWQMVRAVPEMARAAASAVRLARSNRADLNTSAVRSAPAGKIDDTALISAPVVVVYIDEKLWQQRAEVLGGTSNSLFAGLAARLGQIVGRVDGRGMVKLSLPVSERTEDDTRGNALTGMMLTIDPSNVATSLRELRAEMKKNLADLSENSLDLLGPLALTPLVPVRLARRLEGMALGSDSPVGCSNLGRVPAAVNRPDGSDAEFVFVRQAESRITAEILDRLGGMLFLASLQVNGVVSVSVSAWTPGGDNSAQQLAAWVRTALEDFGLTGSIEGAPV